MSLKIAVFIDGTWLWHNMTRLKTQHGCKIDLGKLPQWIVQQIQDLYLASLKYEMTIFCASLPINVDNRDERMVSGMKSFYELLQKAFNYTVEIYDLDFKGRRYLKQDRDPLDSWEPKEKCVDVALATNIIYHIAINTCDVAVIVAGDRDFQPVFEKVRALEKNIHLVSFRESCSEELLKESPIWINDHLSTLGFSKDLAHFF